MISQFCIKWTEYRHQKLNFGSLCPIYRRSVQNEVAIGHKNELNFIPKSQIWVVLTNLLTILEPFLVQNDHQKSNFGRFWAMKHQFGTIFGRNKVTISQFWIE